MICEPGEEPDFVNCPHLEMGVCEECLVFCRSTLDHYMAQLED